MADFIQPGRKTAAGWERHGIYYETYPCTTFISGVDDEKVDTVIGIIAKYSSRRTQIVPSTSTMEVGMYSSFPVEVTVGGSTIFVLNVDRFEKV